MRTRANAAGQNTAESVASTSGQWHGLPLPVTTRTDFQIGQLVDVHSDPHADAVPGLLFVVTEVAIHADE